MSLRSRRSVQFVIVAALLGIGSFSASAPGQTIAPPPLPEAEASATAVTRTSAHPKVDAVETSELAPLPAPAEPATNAAAEAGAPPAAPVEPAPSSAAAPAEATHASPLVIDVEAALARFSAAKSVDKRDREGLVAAYKARENRPIWMSAKGATPEALKLAAEIGKAGDWGLDAADFPLPSLEPSRPDGADLAADAIADAEVRLSLATLKYARYARGGRLDPTEITPFLDRKPPVLEPASVLQQIATAAEPDAYLRKLHPQHPQFERLRLRYLAVRDEPEPRKGPSEAERLLANMEQWRWMPAELGRFYVWASIPEQLLRVVRNGQVIHTERIVVGKANAQTPIFSHEMRHIIFHPFWGVPDSIKVNELLPSLQRGGSALARQNLKLQLNGKEVDPSRYDWTRTDIRRFHVYQPPGGGNALGIVKFMFPNKHAVYMHDTPSKSLFKAGVRTFSHGCMRVQDPVRLAELLLGEDRGMSPEQVRALTRKDAPENNQVNLSSHIPVHMTYFTMWSDDSGKVTSFNDIYGHEERIRLALAGKMDLIKPVPAPKTPTDPIGHLVEVSPSFSGFSSGGPAARGGYSGGSSGPGFNTVRPAWAKQVFSDGGAFSGGN